MMSANTEAQNQRSDFEEQCINCGDSLIAKVNWNVGDLMGDIRYCTKEQCQTAKPILISSEPTPRVQGKKMPIQG